MPVLDTIFDGPFLLAKLPARNMSSVSAGRGIRSSAARRSGRTSTSGSFLCGRNSGQPVAMKGPTMQGTARFRRYVRFVSLTILAFAALSGSAQIAGTPAMATERPAAPEKNPPGDMPDTQVFVIYISPLGFSLKVPEGWARTDRRDAASFFDKYNALNIAVASAASAPTPTSAADHEAADLVKTGRAVRIEAIRKVVLRSGPALLIMY